MKKIIVILLVLFVSIGTNAQTFVLSEIIPPPSYTTTQEELNEANKNIGKWEVTLTFTDKDVRMAGIDKKGDYRSEILQNMGNNIYRKYTTRNPDSYDEIEIIKYLGVISSFTFTHIHYGKVGGKMVFKRKLFK